MSNTPYIFNADQEAWLRDLETTTEPQTTDVLHRLIADYDDDGILISRVGYCCLGRACVTLGLPASNSGGELEVFAGFSETSLPEEGVDRLDNQ